MADIIGSTEDLNSADYDKLSNLIDLIQTINVDEELAVMSTDLIKADLDHIISELDSLDQVQEEESEGNEKLKNLDIKAGKLLKNLKFMKEVFDSTDGYTSTEEEDETYYGISKDLFQLIGELEQIIQNVDSYKQNDEFDDIDSFEEQTLDSISQISDSLENHKDVLENIDWVGKLGRRKEELDEALRDTKEIIEDGNQIAEDLSDIYQDAMKNAEDNKELIEKFDDYIQTVNSHIDKIKELEATLQEVEPMISDYEASIMIHDEQNMEAITEMMMKNKDIKEQINKTMDQIEDLDGEIDEIAKERDSKVKKKSKYKAK